MLISYTPTPIQEIKNNALATAGIRLLVKREDLNHPEISGNKWWKLCYNLEEARSQNKKALLTFGGAYSNHIYATAAAAREAGFKSIGIVRGEEVLPLNDTLQFAKNCGMELHFISRSDYRKKDDLHFIDNLHSRHGDFYLVPEGGTNMLAVKGCSAFTETFRDVDFDYVCLPVGTGGTIAGIIAGLKGEKEVIGISVLKGGEFLTENVSGLVKKYCGKDYGNWSIRTSYDHGGYAKVTDELLTSMQVMKDEHSLPLDPVYTGKLLYAVLEETRRGFFRRGATVLALHTGGLQGRY